MNASAHWFTDRTRNRGSKRESEIVLLCNPRAGGRWKELAKILDSEEASHVRRIVTDSVEDIAPAVSDLGAEAELVCMYGGDGTVQRILDHMLHGESEIGDTILALLGGGTMNVTSRWLGFGSSPSNGFEHVVRGFRSGDLLFKEVPLMQVKVGSRVHYGFTFGMGGLVRILDAYERGKKGKPAALKIASQAIAGAIFGVGPLKPILGKMQAKVTLDGEVLPYDKFSAVFTNVTGQLNPGIEPFAGGRTRDSFYTAAYAVSARELALSLPMIARGLLPIDLSSMLRKWGRGKVIGPIDTNPRYINRSASTMVIETEEPLYTIDGEVLEKPPGPIEVTIGPTVKLATGPQATVTQALTAVRSMLKR